MHSILRWIDITTNSDDFVIILGDFNTLPISQTYQLIINNNFLSVFSHFNKIEPLLTFHSKMNADTKDSGLEGTYDYIFLRKNKIDSFKINFVDIFGQEPSLVDEGIYASDHFALFADISFI